METHGVGYSTTGLVAQMRESGNLWQFKGITVKLANAYGYCWGVERAVQMAYEARKAYPGQKLYVTNEIIHNPAVNQVYSRIVVACINDVSTEYNTTADSKVFLIWCMHTTAQALQHNFFSNQTHVAAEAEGNECRDH